MKPRYGTSLAQLEKRLAALNAQRERVIVNIKAVVAGLTAGAREFVERERRELRPARKAARRTRRFSKAARAKLAAAARRRWAAAKKAGKKRLG